MSQARTQIRNRFLVLADDKSKSMAKDQLPLERVFPPECVLDKTRKDFVHEQGLTIQDLMNGDLKQRNRFRRLLLGCKGVGKTMLLKSLIQAASKAYPELLTLYVSYADTQDVEFRLAKAICRHLKKSGINLDVAQYLQEACVDESTCTIIQKQGLNWYDHILFGSEEYFRNLGITAGMASELVASASTPPLFTRISGLLQLAGKRLFLVVDEFQDLYTTATDSMLSRLTIKDAYALGEDTNGQIHCIISGSSTYLRHLAFAKLPKDLHSQFPNYSSLDLNSTKYQARWIYPFLDEQSLVNLYQTMNKGPPHSDIINTFLQTGGSPGCLSELIRGSIPSTYHISIKSVKFNPAGEDERAKVLRAIYKAYTRVPDDNPLDIFARTAFLTPIHLSYELGNSPESILYDMADAGLIRYVVEGHPPIKKVGFGNPLVFLETLKQGKPTLSAIELVALCFPRDPGIEQIAENAVCRLLATAFHSVINCQVLKYSEKPLSLHGTGNDADTGATFFDHYVMYKELVDGRDICGADAVVLVPSSGDQKQCDAHRVQVKLGGSTICTTDELNSKKIKCCDTAEDIASKFKRQEQVAREAYARSNINLSRCIHYLATTRDITTAAQEHLNQNDIRILNKSFFQDKVWPAELKEFGRPFS